MSEPMDADARQKIINDALAVLDSVGWEVMHQTMHEMLLRKEIDKREAAEKERDSALIRARSAESRERRSRSEWRTSIDNLPLITRQIAGLLGVSSDAVRRLINNGGIKRHGTDYQATVGSVLAFKAQRIAELRAKLDDLGADDYCDCEE